MPICKAKYSWTSDDYVTVMQRHYSFKFRREFKILLKLTAALLLAFVMFLAFVAIVFPDAFDQPPYWSFVAIAVVCVYALIYDRINVWYWRRNFRKDPKRFSETEWTFADEAVAWRSSLGEGTLKWEAFLKVVEVVDGFFFYATKNIFFWIPFSSFEAAECIATTRDLIVKNKCPLTQQK